jgi:hypothetical protein
MSRIMTVIVIYHRHKPIDLTPQVIFHKPLLEMIIFISMSKKFFYFHAASKFIVVFIRTYEWTLPILLIYGLVNVGANIADYV